MAYLDDVAGKLRELGVASELVPDQAKALAIWLLACGIDGQQAVAVLQLVQQSFVFAGEREEGPGFRERANSIVEIISAGDEPTKNQMRRDFS